MFRFPRALIAGLVTGLLGLILVPFCVGLEENIGLELLFRLRGTREVPSDIVIVTLDKVSADELNLSTEPDKWPRSFHARLIDALVEKGAKVIAFDMLFEESSPKEEDQLFAQSIKNAGNVVLCECLKRETAPLPPEKDYRKGALSIERLIPPIQPLAQSAVAIAPFPLPKVPVKVSQYWTMKTGAGDTPTLPIVVYQLFAFDHYRDFVHLVDRVDPSTAVNLPIDKDAIISAKGVEELVSKLMVFFRKDPKMAGDMLKELQGHEQFSADHEKKQTLRSMIKMYQGPNSRYLNFYGPPGTVTTVPYCQVIHQKGMPGDGHSLVDLKGKAVFVGLSETLRPEQKDGFYSVFSQPSGLDISGVEIAATAFANLLEDMPVDPAGFPTNIITIFLWGILLGLFCWLIAPGVAAGFTVGVSAGYFALSYLHFKHAAIWHPLVIPLFVQAPFAFFSSLLWKYFETSKERKNIRSAFGYYLPDSVVDRLAKDIGHIKTDNQIVYGTCLNTDAEQYTTLSETMHPNELSQFMNKYYEAVFEPVKKHGGIVSDVIGDSMLAIWATTNPDVAVRSKACQAALDIAGEVNRFNLSSGTLQLPTRIGLHSGQMLLGNIGAADHYEYRPVGDIVNTVSRIEGLNKYLDTCILATQQVLIQIDDFLTREIGTFLLAGKSRPIVVHEIISRKEDSDHRQQNLCTIFAKGLHAFQKRSWEDAMDIFSHNLKNSDEDGPSRFYLELCEKHRAHPPEENWDGLVQLNTK